MIGEVEPRAPSCPRIDDSLAMGGSKNGVASLAYGSPASRQGTPGACLSEMAGTSPAMTESMIQSETITR
jgi:hypothetical protein